MPWSHCNNEFLLDDEPCETCGLSKAEWTIEVDKTRVLRIGVKRATPTATTWVEVSLRDPDGAPVGGEPFVVLTPDGRRREGTLDERGLARVEGVPEGRCQVSFPRRAPRPASDRWLVVELVLPDGRPAVGERFEVWLAGARVHEGVLGPGGRARVEGVPADHCQVTFPGRGSSLVRAWSPEPPPPLPPRPGPRRALELELELADEDGRPVPFEPFVVRLPDGRHVEGVLDARGRARVPGVDAGRCEVRFPERDGSAWRKRQGQTGSSG